MSNSRVDDIRKMRTAPSETPAQILRRKFDYEFIDLMRNRMIVGTMRYGTDRDPWEERIISDPTIVSTRRLMSKLIQFIWTGNTEFLVDVAVYAMLIYRFGTNVYFVATERHNIQDIKDSGDNAAEILVEMIEDAEINGVNAKQVGRSVRAFCKPD